MSGGTMFVMAIAALLAHEAPTGPLAGLLWSAFGLGGICYGFLGKEYRKGRFGQGEIITSPWLILRDRIGWCLWGAACLFFSYDAFRH
jgi:hypothetical protein